MSGTPEYVEDGTLGKETSTSIMEKESTSQDHVDDNVLHRGLQARHITMIAIGGAIGTGLIVGTGAILARAGPGSLLISYCIVGSIVFLILAGMGEVAAWLPMASGFSGYATRYCHPSLGFTLGWCYWILYALAAPSQLTAASLVIQFWVDRERVSPAVFITVFLVAIVAINYLGIKFFGEFEFWLSSFKVLVIVLVLFVSLVVALGGGPDGDRRGFRYWNNPGAFAEYIDTGPTGKFLAFWSTLSTAVFSFFGTELVGVTAGEAQNPRRTIPRAIRLTFYRILVFYVLAVVIVGMLVPYNSQALAFATKQGTGASASPFVVAMQEAGINGLDHAINAAICLFVFSASNSDLYIASRALYGVARVGSAPKIFAKTDPRGVPVYALGASAAIALLAYMNVADSSTTVFGYFVNLSTVFGLLSWMSLLVTHIFFVKARRAQNIPVTALAYIAPLGIWGSYISLVMCGIITLTKSYDVFTHKLSPPGHFDYKNFITSYLGIVVFFALFLGHKLLTNSKFVNARAADLETGKDIIDREEEAFLAAKAHRLQNNKNIKRRSWFYKTFVSWLF